MWSTVTSQNPNYHNPFAEESKDGWQQQETQTFPSAEPIKKPSRSNYNWVKYIIAMLILFGSIAGTTYLLFPPPPPPVASVQTVTVPVNVTFFDDFDGTSMNTPTHWDYVWIENNSGVPGGSGRNVTYWINTNSSNNYTVGGLNYSYSMSRKGVVFSTGDIPANTTHYTVVVGAGGGGGSVSYGTMDQAGVWHPGNEPENTTNITQSNPTVQEPIPEIIETTLLFPAIIIVAMMLFLSEARNTTFLLIGLLGIVSLLSLFNLILLSHSALIIFFGSGFIFYKWIVGERS